MLMIGREMTVKLFWRIGSEREALCLNTSSSSAFVYCIRGSVSEQLNTHIEILQNYKKKLISFSYSFLVCRFRS